MVAGRAARLDVLPIAACLLLMLGGLYALSIGPAAWLLESQHVSLDAYERYCSPAEWVCDRSPESVYGAIEIYVGLWTALPSL